MNTPTLTISLNVKCPHCESYLDLLDPDLGMNDEAEIMRQAIPEGNTPWSDEHRKFKEDVTCPDCGETFICEGIDW